MNQWAKYNKHWYYGDHKISMEKICNRNCNLCTEWDKTKENVCFDSEEFVAVQTKEDQNEGNETKIQKEDEKEVRTEGLSYFAVEKNHFSTIH